MFQYSFSFLLSLIFILLPSIFRLIMCLKGGVLYGSKFK
nr:MAG TPA: PsbA, PsbB, PsbC, PsbD, PsbE-FCP supercomplex, PLANT PROTEIN [Caudoviricetes sp.]